MKEKHSGELSAKLVRKKATNNDLTEVQSIVHKRLGLDFKTDNSLPPNKGIKGDEPLYGETILVTPSCKEQLARIYSDPDYLDETMREIANKVDPVCKVVLDISSLAIKGSISK